MRIGFCCTVPAAVICLLCGNPVLSNPFVHVAPRPVGNQSQFTHLFSSAVGNFVEAGTSSIIELERCSTSNPVEVRYGQNANDWVNKVTPHFFLLRGTNVGFCIGQETGFLHGNIFCTAQAWLLHWTVALRNAVNEQLTNVKALFLGQLQDRSGFIWVQSGSWTNLSLGAPQHTNGRLIELKPTVGLCPPQSAIVLFDGTGFAQWAKQDPKRWDMPAGEVKWRLVGDAMEVVPGTGSIISKKTFGDCRIHLEFNIVGAVNSGVYVQSRYEVALKDSFGHYEGLPCGAPGNFSGSFAITNMLNAAAPPGQWQSLDIEFRAPRFDKLGNKTRNAVISVWLNGVLLYENLEITSVKGAAKRLGESARGPIALQEHGAPIQFRNIWVIEYAE